MISPYERREVAERLREVTDGERAAMFLEEILCGILGDRWCRDGDFQISDKLILLRLADLIDPTCHIAPDDWASQQCMGPMLSCDRCQAAFPEINSPYVYCPNCGARVVEG